MICASLYLLVFIQILLMHLAEKILLLQPLTFGGDYHCRWAAHHWPERQATGAGSALGGD
jgi:hypothetical protein